MSATETSAFYRYKSEHGVTETARRLSELLGQEIPAKRVGRVGKTAPVPKAWRQALALDDEQTFEQVFGSPPGEEPEPEAPPSERKAEQPPRPPAGTKLQPPTLQVMQQAKERIEALHVFAGSSIATAADADGFQNGTGPGGGIAALWADKSGEIAAAWIAWAEEGNRFAQSFVRLMGTGGAGGNLVIGYAALLGGTAYILGQLPDNDATRLVYGRYSRYRAVVPTPGDTAGAADAAGDNGAAPVSSPDSLVGTAGPARL